MAPTPKPVKKVEDANKVTSATEFATFASDLTEEEILQAIRIVKMIQEKYAHKRNTAENLDQLRDEALTRLANVGILATFDPTPCFYGEPPNLEFVGKVAGDSLHEHGFDHEKKQYEVRKAVSRGEDYLGQKENPNSRGDKK